MDVNKLLAEKLHGQLAGAHHSSVPGDAESRGWSPQSPCSGESNFGGKNFPGGEYSGYYGGESSFGGAYGFVEMVFQKLDTLQLWGLRMSLLAETKSCYICKIFKSLRTNGNGGFC